MDADDGIHNNFTLSKDINGPLLAAVIGMEMLVGLITNSFVLILTAFHCKTWKKQPSAIFLTNMFICNLMIILFVMPVPIITLSTGKWIYGRTMEEKVLVCEFIACFLFFSFIVDIESLVLLSFDRFFFIVKALQYKRFMTASKAVIIVFVSWIVAALLSTPPLFGFGTFEFAYSYGTCVPGWEGQPGYTLYVVIVVGIYISCITVTSLWTLIFTRRYLKNRNIRRNIVSAHDQENCSYRYLTTERKLIGMFGMLLLIHFICFLPVLAIGFLGLIIIIPPEP